VETSYYEQNEKSSAFLLRITDDAALGDVAVESGKGCPTELSILNVPN